MSVPANMRLTRRQFLAYCGKLAVLMALPEAAIPRIASALEGLAASPSVIWSMFLGCSGCSVQLLQNRSPGPAALILREISLDYHAMLMGAAGDGARAAFERAVSRDGYTYVVEGAVPIGLPGACTVAGRPALEVLREAAQSARHVLAVGNCAAYGGVQAARPDPTGAVGVHDALGGDEGGRAVVSIPTCPANADALLAVLTHLALYGREPELDVHGRPTFLYGQTVHRNCPRRAAHDQGEFVRRFGGRDEGEGHCLLKMGCKGPETHAPCPTLEWNDHASWCVRVGPCIGCAEPGFWDRFSPLSSPLSRTPVTGLTAATPETLAGVVGGAAAVGLGAHFIGEAATDRLPWSRPRGEEPDADDSPEPSP